MAPFDRRYTIFYWSAIVNIALFGTVFQLFDAEYHDLEIWVTGHSKSFKPVPFESLGAVSYSLLCGSILHHLRDKARYWSKSDFFFIPALHSTYPLGGSLSEYCHPVWYRKTKTVELPDGEKFLRICTLCSEKKSSTTVFLHNS